METVKQCTKKLQLLRLRIKIFFTLQPCSDTYGGTAPFTEPEASIVRDVFDRYDDEIKLYVAIHSCGQYFLYPWGYDL